MLCLRCVLKNPMYRQGGECPERHITGPQSILCCICSKTYVSAHNGMSWKSHSGTTKHALPCIYKNLCIGTRGECPEIYIYNGTTRHALPCFYKNLWLCIGKGECPEIYIYNGTTKHAFELNFVAILLQVIFVEIFLQWYKGDFCKPWQMLLTILSGLLVNRNYGKLLLVRKQSP
jgi:hypothetical protein